MSKTNPSSPLQRPLLKGLVGLLVGVAFMWLSLRNTNIESVLQCLGLLKASWLLLAVGLYALGISVRSYRWQILLLDIRRLNYLSVLSALIVGYSVNNIIPARLGEFYRAHWMGQLHGASRSAIFGSIVVERVLDGLCVVFCLVLGLYLTSSNAG